MASATPGAAREGEEGRGGGAVRGEAEGDGGVKGTIEENVEGAVEETTGETSAVVDQDGAKAGKVGGICSSAPLRLHGG